MMTGPLLVAAAWCTLRPTLGFLPRTANALLPLSSSAAFTRTRSSRSIGRVGSRRLASSSSDASSSLDSKIESNISRLGTLQTLLSAHGAPGSQGCSARDGDLVALSPRRSDSTPELLSSMGLDDDNSESTAALVDLHPYLLPLAQSQSTGNLVCAYRNPATEESDSNHPWPIVESKVGAPGMQLLSLNSEHLMRRIVCELDFDDNNNDNLVQLYNEGLGQGLLKDQPALDTPYKPGSVAQLGYGVDKFVLLRVGPFPDLYADMARQHFGKGDEQSSLIAAEAANGKLSGFASTFRFYARLLSSFDNREEETRDAARMCLRMPLPTIGMEACDYEEVAVLGQMMTTVDSSASSTSSTSSTTEPGGSTSLSDMSNEALQKMSDMYDLMKSVEEEDPHQSGKTAVQSALEDAEHLINQTVLKGERWTTIRPKLGEIFRSVGRDDMASFVEV